jgi:hypothetical protein
MISLRDAALSALRLTSQGVPIQGPATRPNMSVSQVSSNGGEVRMTIIGSGFLHGSSVTVNIRNSRTTTLTPVRTNSDLNGVIQIGSQPVAGSSGDSLMLAATDGRQDLADLTQSLWSNAVNFSVP